MALAKDRQKEYSDKHGRGNLSEFKIGDLVLLDTRNLPLRAVSSVESNKLKHRFIVPFTVLGRYGAAYTIDLPESMTTHPTFYVGRLKRYHGPNLVVDSEPQGRARALEQPRSQAREQPKGRSHSRPQALPRPQALGTHSPRVE